MGARLVYDTKILLKSTKCYTLIHFHSFQISLGVWLMLTMVTLNASIQQQLPEVSYVKVNIIQIYGRKTYNIPAETYAEKTYIEQDKLKHTCIFWLRP